MKFSFIRQFINSISNIEWLKAQRKNYAGAWAYTILFLFIVVCLQFLPTLWHLPREINSLWNDAKVHVPEFEATVEDGRLDISGVEEPLVYPFSFDNNDGLIYVNTNTSTAPVSSEDVVSEDIEFGVVVTTEEVTFVQRSAGVLETDAISFSAVDEPLSFTKADLIEKGNQIVTWGGRLLVPIILFVLFVAVTIGRVLIVAIQSLIVWLIARFANKSWRYGELFHIGLFALTLPSLVMIAVYAFGIHIPFLFSTLLLFMLLLVVFKEPAVSVKEVQEKTPQHADKEKENDKNNSSTHK